MKGEIEMIPSYLIRTDSGASIESDKLIEMLQDMETKRRVELNPLIDDEAAVLEILQDECSSSIEEIHESPDGMVTVLFLERRECDLEKVVEEVKGIIEKLQEQTKYMNYR